MHSASFSFPDNLPPRLSHHGQTRGQLGMLHACVAHLVSIARYSYVVYHPTLVLAVSELSPSAAFDGRDAGIGLCNACVGWQDTSGKKMS